MHSLDGTIVLITGANGFIGQRLINKLGPSNAAIHGVSRSVVPLSDRVRWWRGDLTNGDWLQKLIREIKPDIIYQLASASQGGQEAHLVMPCFENDLLTTVNALIAARDCGCRRIVLVASLEEPVYDGRPITLSSPYAAAKAASTFYGLMFHQLYGLPVTILRPFMAYGPGQKFHKLIPYTILSLLRGESPKLSSGTRPVDWVYVDDVVQAFITAAVETNAVGRVIDLGSGKLVSIRGVVESIHQLLPGTPAPQFGAVPSRLRENVRLAETEMALNALGWKATTTLIEGLSKTIHWCRQEAATSRDEKYVGG